MGLASKRTPAGVKTTTGLSVPRGSHRGGTHRDRRAERFRAYNIIFPGVYTTRASGTPLHSESCLYIVSFMAHLHTGLHTGHFSILPPNSHHDGVQRIQPAHVQNQATSPPKISHVLLGGLDTCCALQRYGRGVSKSPRGQPRTGLIDGRGNGPLRYRPLGVVGFTGVDVSGSPLLLYPVCRSPASHVFVWTKGWFGWRVKFKKENGVI